MHCLNGRTAVLIAGFLAPIFAQTSNPNALAQASKPAWPPPGPTPHTADGKPDLSGAWAPNAIRQNVDLVATGVQVPFQPWAEKVYKQHTDNISKDDPEARCLPLACRA